MFTLLTAINELSGFSCPFSQSYMYGMERAHDMSDTKAKLIKHNYVIAMGEVILWANYFYIKTY